MVFLRPMTMSEDDNSIGTEFGPITNWLMRKIGILI